MRNLRRRRYLYVKFGRRIPLREIEPICNVLKVFPGAQLRDDPAVDPSAAP
jgi:hypothetical protein